MQTFKKGFCGLFVTKYLKQTNIYRKVVITIPLKGEDYAL